MGNTIGYLRVSTIDQDLEKNKHNILDFANDKDFGKVEWVEEKVSGKISWKERKIKGVIDELNEGEARALQKDCIVDGEIIIKRTFSDNQLRETTKTGRIRRFPITSYFQRILVELAYR